MLLSEKHAVIYGGGGAIGSAVAAAFEREGALVYCPSRAEVDALDSEAVDAHARSLPRIDISFNVISHDVVQGTAMVEMDVEDYVRPVAIGVRTNFITARAAARRMIEQGGGGAILFFGGEGHPVRGFHLGALQTGFHAIEAMRRQLALELGRHGIRTVTLRTAGVPESIPDSYGERKQAIAASTAEASALGRAATLSDVGRVAAFVASDHARTMTAATVNISAGALID